MRNLKKSLFVCIGIAVLTSCGVSKYGTSAPDQNDASGQVNPPPDGGPGPKSTDGASGNAPQKRNSSLVFSGIDPLAAPWQASIFRLDLATSKVEKLLSGESSDPAIYPSGGEILFFNRSFDSQNFRRLATSEGSKVSVSSQLRFAGGELGDPHDALYLGHNQVLLAHYTAGKLVVMEQSSGKEQAVVEADWDLPNGASLRPEALWLTQVDGRTLVYVIHQGLMIKDGLMRANGTQQVFVLELKDGKLTPQDLDPAVPKIQGIKLKGSFPMPVRFAKRGKILLVSMCSRYVLGAADAQAKPCVSAVEELDPKTNTVTVLWDLEGTDVFMNGPVTPGPNANSFYANVEQQTTATTFKKMVMIFNAGEHTMAPVYQFKPESGGYWGSFYDETAKKLYIGDMADTSTGKFVVIDEGGGQKEIPLERVPYSGAFMATDGP